MTGDVVEAVVVDETPPPAHGPKMTELLHVLGGIMREDADAAETVIAWGNEQHVREPMTAEDHAARVLEGIRSGEALPISFPVQPETPVELLERILGATTIHDDKLTTEQAHARAQALREDHEDAAAVSVPPHAPGGAQTGGGGFSAYQAERDALRSQQKGDDA